MLALVDRHGLVDRHEAAVRTLITSAFELEVRRVPLDAHHRPGRGGVPALRRPGIAAGERTARGRRDAVAGVGYANSGTPVLGHPDRLVSGHTKRAAPSISRAVELLHTLPCVVVGGLRCTGTVRVVRQLGDRRRPDGTLPELGQYRAVRDPVQIAFRLRQQSDRVTGAGRHEKAENQQPRPQVTRHHDLHSRLPVSVRPANAPDAHVTPSRPRPPECTAAPS